MRFTLVSAVLVALVHLLAPVVHGAPAVAPDHVNALAVRQAEIPATLVSAILGLLSSLLGPSSEALQPVQSALAVLNLSARGPPIPSGPISQASASSTSHTVSTTTSVGLVPNAVGSASSGISRVSPTARARRQLPPIPSLLPSLGVPQTLTSIVGVVTSKLPVPKPTTSTTSSSQPSSTTTSHA